MSCPPRLTHPLDIMRRSFLYAPSLSDLANLVGPAPPSHLAPEVILPSRIQLHKACDVCTNSCLYTFHGCDFAEVRLHFPLTLCARV